MDLKYITREMSDPRGKPKVYFACHPEDFDTAFPLLTKDILDHVNCAIWYDAELTAGKGETEMEEELEWILKDMQLVVFAITSRFIYGKSRAKDVELPAALRKRVPVLPIALENGLGNIFSEKVSKDGPKIQLVSKYVTDPTATPYEDVLQTYLDSVIVGEKLASRVRDAFDAYVFLSYRKKDRKHAQRLMRLIHENKQFRDIAIWYDEYLIPGEDFHKGIEDAFQKSSLFAMAVTPHLEEPGNFVMKEEYPMARKRKSKGEKEKTEDFEIVPVEMYEKEDAKDGKDWRIDLAKVKEQGFQFTDLPDLQDEHRRQELDKTLIDALSRIAKKENNGSAVHKFFIGLAYLCGIDVEVNKRKALSLFVHAALDKDPCMEATAKLADMYLNGEGVNVNLERAVCWQGLLAEQYKAAYDKNHDPDEHKGYGTAYFKALRKLSDIYKDAGKTREAIEAAGRALNFCAELEREVGVREQERDKALILNRLGSLYLETGKEAAAEDCFVKAGRIYEKQAGEIGTQRARRDLSIGYERLGDLCRKKKDLDSAESYYQKAKALREKLLSETLSAGARRDLSSVLTKLGNVRKSRKEFAEAGKYYGEALAIDQVLAGEIRSPQAWDDYGVSLTKIGDVQKAEGKLPEAAHCYRKACGIFKKNTEKTDSRIFKDHEAGGTEKYASALKKLGKTKEADRLYREAVALREQLYEEGKTVSAAHALATVCYNTAVFSNDKALLLRAYEIWTELSTDNPAYGKYREKAEKQL